MPEYFARVCWNSRGWVEPTGEAAALESKSTYARRHGFGHEEWLFDPSARVGEWQYGFLQPIRKSLTGRAKPGTVMDLRLWSLSGPQLPAGGGGGGRHYVHWLRCCEVISKEHATEIVEGYRQNGRAERMSEQLMALGIDPGPLSGNPHLIVNVRFPAEQVHGFTGPTPAPATDAIHHILPRYQLELGGGGVAQILSEWPVGRRAADGGEEAAGLGYKGEVGPSSLRDVRTFLAQRGVGNVLLVRHDLDSIERMREENRPLGYDFILRANATGVEWVAVFEATNRQNAILRRLYRYTGTPPAKTDRPRDFDWQHSLKRADDEAAGLENHLVIPRWPNPPAYCIKRPDSYMGAYLSLERVSSPLLASVAVPGVNHEERAARAWPILVASAQARGSVTYAQLGDRLGIHHRVMGLVLSVIQDYCLRMQLPPLTVLVVSKQGKVGSGFIAGDSEAPQQAREEVFGYAWENVGNPFAYALDGSSVATIATGLVEYPDTAEDVYRRVRDRGSSQSVFRAALLCAYESRCAFCGLSIEAALDGAHIIPWAEAGPADRVHPRNGLLLCATHHRMFDQGLLTVSAEYIVAAGDRLAAAGTTALNHSAVGAVVGERIYRPAAPGLQPDASALRSHREKHAGKGGT